MEAEPVGEMATIPDRRLAVFATFSMVHTVAPRVVLTQTWPPSVYSLGPGYPT